MRRIKITKIYRGNQGDLVNLANLFDRILC